MNNLTFVTAAFSAMLAVFAFSLGDAVPWYLVPSGAAMATIAWFSRPISAFLKVFIVMYALGFMFLAGMTLLGALGWLPEGIKALLPPAFMASASVVFALIVLGASFIPVVRTVTAIADPYFVTREPAGDDYGWLSRLFRTRGGAASAILGIMIAGNFVQVALSIRLNLWYRDMFNALEKKDAPAFWEQIWAVFVPLLVIWIVFQLINLVINSLLYIRWRTWMTQSYLGRWLGNGTHYRMQVLQIAADNPDQRISTDVASFITETTSLSVSMLKELATLVSFTVVLWGISGDFVLPGTDLVVPGFLVWVALVYAIVGTYITHVIGRPLIRLDFDKERVEANFRFSLARLREYGEQVALLSGAPAEEQTLRRSFGDIVRNYIAILTRKLKLISFTFSWSQMSVAFPYILTGSYYFAGKITLGQVQQASQAFGSVNDAMSFFIDRYQTLAAYKAILDRLTTFNEGMAKGEGLKPALANAPSPPTSAPNDLLVTNFTLALPTGKTIVAAEALVLHAGERTLLIGPSGSGKSTLFRALAGIWPFGSGTIALPPGRSVMLLPQQPYIPQGTLRDAVTYPGLQGAFTDDAIRDALRDVRLEALVDRLDEDQLWAQTLSGGERQRLAIARALLARPDWLFLDEATASLDEKLEKTLYGVILEKLPETTVVSIGHRSTLEAFHNRKLVMEEGRDGVYGVRDVREKVAAE